MPELPPAISKAPPEPKPRQHLAAGTIIAERYQILDVLGEGSMGTVYAAEHLPLKKKMALKVLHQELTSVKSLAIRFEREAMATAKLDHPNVAAAVDFGRLADGSMYLALEFVEGRSLRSEIAKGAFVLGRALHVARQIASLLSVAQPLGIVHRDLKPENVMLVQRGDDPDFVKVLDFGIARMTGPVEGDAGPTQALTKVGAVFGTPEYMAPEQALGQRVDTRADLYSLGVMLFEMIAGVRPYASVGGQSGILAQQITAPRPSFADVAPQLKLPEDIERVVNRLLAKGVAERYQRASDLVQILDGFAADKESVGPTGSLVPARKEALPAFELTTHVPGLTDSDENAKRASSAATPGWSRGLVGQRLEHLQAWMQPRLTSCRTGTARLAMALRGRLTRWFGPKLAGIPPLAILTFCVGLSFGLVVAIAVWLLSARGSGTAEPLPSAALSAPADPSSAPSSVSSAGPASSAAAATAIAIDNSKDPDVMLGAMHEKLQAGRDAEAVGLAVKVLSKHPDRRTDGRIAEVLYRAANAQAKETADTAFALLEGTMAKKGADILYQLWLDKGVRESTRRRAEKWLRSEQLAKAGSNALAITVQLRLAETCEKKSDLLPLAAKGGSAFALTYLRELETDQGCGIEGKSDCYPCLRKDNRLKDAIAQIETRLAQ